MKGLFPTQKKVFFAAVKRGEFVRSDFDGKGFLNYVRWEEPFISDLGVSRKPKNFVSFKFLLLQKYNSTKMSGRQVQDAGLDDSSDLEDSWAAEDVMLDGSPSSRNKNFY